MKKIASILLVLAGLRAAAQPTISSVSPLVGLPGSSVTITGTNFNTTPANDAVYFGATRASVTSASATSLTVTVPIGATYMSVSVNNVASSLTAYSDKYFLPTYDNSAYVPGAINFDPKLTLATGVEPYGIAIADIDGDGKGDLAVVSFIDTVVYVYRNISSSGSITLGSFAAPVTFKCAFQPQAIVVADIDGDGKPDITVSNIAAPTGGDFSVLRNTSSAGAVSFDSEITFIADNEPMGIVVGDIDGDGRPDVALTNAANNTVSVFHNTSVPGAVGFDPRITLSTASVPWGIAMADLDGDGKPDLLVSNDTAFYVYRNTSSAGSISGSSFDAPVIFPLAGRLFELVVSDIDGDGKPDIVVGNEGYGDGTVTVFRNTAVTGSISSSSFGPQIDFAVGTGANNLAMGDIDGDGKPDVVVEIVGTDSIYVLRNTSPAGSVAFAPRTIFAAGAGGWGMAVGDIDGDGKADVAVANYTDSTVTILRNHPLSTTETAPIASPRSSEVKVLPNPNNGNFSLTGLTGLSNDEAIAIEITDMLGQKVYSNTVAITGGAINAQISLSSSLANGMYLLNLQSANENRVLHFVIEK